MNILVAQFTSLCCVEKLHMIWANSLLVRNPPQEALTYTFNMQNLIRITATVVCHVGESKQMTLHVKLL